MKDFPIITKAEMLKAQSEGKSIDEQITGMLIVGFSLGVMLNISPEKIHNTIKSQLIEYRHCITDQLLELRTG